MFPILNANNWLSDNDIFDILLSKRLKRLLFLLFFDIFVGVMLVQKFVWIGGLWEGVVYSQNTVVSLIQKSVKLIHSSFCSKTKIIE